MDSAILTRLLQLKEKSATWQVFINNLLPFLDSIGFDPSGGGGLTSFPKSDYDYADLAGYVANGQPTEITFLKNEVIVATATITWEGSLATAATTTEGGVTTNYTFSYDESGNLVNLTKN